MSTRAVIQDWSFTTDVPSKLSAQTLLKRSAANTISVVTECGGARHGHVDNGNDYSLHMNRCDASTTLANNPRTGVSADNRTNRSSAPTVLSNTTGIGGGANTSTLPLGETPVMANVYQQGGGANTYATSSTTPLSVVNDNSSSTISAASSNSMSNGGSRIAHARVNLSYLAPTLNQSTCAAVEEVAYEYAMHFPIKDWK